MLLLFKYMTNYYRGENMTDLEMCVHKEYFKIWTKYKMMFFKIWDSLFDTKFDIWPEEADFFSFCYEKTVMAVDSIKPEKVKNPATWTIYIQLYRYISTYAQREIVKESSNKVVSLDAFTEEHDYDENAALKTEDYQEVDMSVFNLEEREFINYVRSGHNWKDRYNNYQYKKLRASITNKLFYK